MAEIYTSSRNIVLDLGKSILKQFSKKIQYEDEKKVYQEFSKKDYIAKLISYNDEKKTLEIEKLYDNMSNLGYVPVDYAVKCYEISKDLYKLGCSYVDDINKMEHWFYIKNVHGGIQLKVIDFDVVDIWNFPSDVTEGFIRSLDEEYAFLFDKNHIESLDKFSERLLHMGFKSIQVEHFVKNYTLL